MKKKNYQITEICRKQMAEYIEPGSLCIDATMGNGHDTLWLCQKCGKQGRVLAFDIQKIAYENTKVLLESALEEQNYELFCESHEYIDQHVEPETVDCITFNLGYLPAGDHQIATKGDVTCRAIERALPLLKRGGLLELCIYSGGDSGFEERETVMSYLEQLDHKKYLVIKTEFVNRKNHPPMPVSVIKL